MSQQPKPGKINSAIEDKTQRINIKSKRKRTLIRKAIEMSQLCSLEILIVIKDRETSKIIEYNSGKCEAEQFTIDAAIKAKSLDSFICTVYNDTSYDHLIPSNKLKVPERPDLLQQ